MIELPWQKRSEDNLDLKRAREILDEDHYGIPKVKERIIEYLAEGAWTKRLHPGWAAQSGVRAALLARGGFLGPPPVLVLAVPGDGVGETGPEVRVPR